MNVLLKVQILNQLLIEFFSFFKKDLWTLYSLGNPAHEHFVQSFSDAAIYTKNPDNGQLSVSVPYEKPQGNFSNNFLFLFNVLQITEKWIVNQKENVYFRGAS